MNLAELNKIAEAMVAPGNGILAADESSGTIKKRFDAIGVESTEESRRDYREMLFRSAEGMKSISGVILRQPSGMRFGGASTAFPLAPSSASARACSVGAAKSLRRSVGSPARLSRSIICTASREWPPSSKKLSCLPTRSTFSSSPQIRASSLSISPSGGSYLRLT